MLPKIKEAPQVFNGTLTELYDRWAQHVLLDLPLVQEFHKQFCAYYLESADPVFLVRMVSGLERGQTMITEYGAKFRPTDNAPAWWIHYRLFSDQFRQSNSFSSFVESIPCHMFQVHLPVNISQAGWHVAHIFDVKDGNVTFQKWDRNELLRRTARNIHPCNYFYIPKTDWQSHGGDPTVIAFFYEKFRSLYRPIWEDFLRLVDGTPPHTAVVANEFRYSFAIDQKPQGFGPKTSENLPTSPKIYENPVVGIGDCVARYEFSRLCFKADVIEPLRLDDRFCIITNEGTFVMTKREFYETFQNVVDSQSYRLNKIYHYPKTPQKAMQFKVNLNKKA